MTDIIKKDTVEEIQEQQPQHKVQLPNLKDYAWEKEQQLLTQRLLFERLNYKRYQRSNSLNDIMQRIGDNYRSGGIIFWLSLVSFLSFVAYLF